MIDKGSKRGKAYRRAREDRARVQALRMVATMGVSVADHARMVGRLTATRGPCSCEMCGNERRHFGIVTHQERIAEVGAREQIAAL
jgi:hypothetical protein